MEFCSLGGESGHAIDNCLGKMVAVDAVDDRHVEWRRGGPLFLKAVHVEVGVVGSPVSQPGGST